MHVHTYMCTHIYAHMCTYTNSCIDIHMYFTHNPPPTYMDTCETAAWAPSVFCVCSKLAFCHRGFICNQTRLR